jgi:acyl carrier protein
MNGLFERVKQIIVDEMGVDESEVTSEARFIEDLGADSLDLVETIIRFEEEFNLEIPDEDAEKLQSVRDVMQYLSSSYISPEDQELLLDRKYLSSEKK